MRNLGRISPFAIGLVILAVGVIGATGAVLVYLESESYAVKGLKDPSPEWRIWAANKLASKGPAAKGAVPALAGALLDADDIVRRDAARAIGKIGAGSHITESVVNELIRVLKTDTYYDTRSSAAWALGRLRCYPEVVVPELVAALNDPDPNVERAVRSALAISMDLRQDPQGKKIDLNRWLIDEPPPAEFLRDKARSFLQNASTPPEPNTSDD